MSLAVKCPAERRGDHIHMRVFLGADEEHLQLTGTLVMDVGQWQLFVAALIHGIEEMRKGHMPIRYIRTDCVGLNDPGWGKEESA